MHRHRIQANAFLARGKIDGKCGAIDRFDDFPAKGLMFCNGADHPPVYDAYGLRVLEGFWLGRLLNRRGRFCPLLFWLDVGGVELAFLRRSFCGPPRVNPLLAEALIIEALHVEVV